MSVHYDPHVSNLILFPSNVSNLNKTLYFRLNTLQILHQHFTPNLHHTFLVKILHLSMVFIKTQFTHLQSDSFQTTLKALQNHTPTQSMIILSIKKKEQNQLDKLAEFQPISGKNILIALNTRSLGKVTGQN